jgi:hypothetical protein
MNRMQNIGAIAAALAIAPAAWSMGNMSEARQQYQHDLAYCKSGQAQEDRATCLKEANAAYAEARRGTLDSSTSAMGAAGDDSGKAVTKVGKKKAKAKKSMVKKAQPAA